MTTQDLILGHFEQALTPAEETLLQQRLGASPEARAMFEQHRNLNGYLNNDAAALAPSSRLDEMTLAAALSVVPEAIAGGSAATWLSGKVIATVAAAIIGGGSIALLTTAGPKETAAPAATTPVVRSVPSAPARITPPAAPEATATTPAVTEPAPAAATAAHRSSAPAVTDRPATKAPAVASKTKAAETKPKLRRPSGETKVNSETTIGNGKR